MKFLPTILIGLALAAPVQAADYSQPIVSDSRVKTFVYNENEVYTILTQYGYQTSIEFGKGEEIQTISVGDRVSWQIVPAGRRLFIQTLGDEARTNMTVVTDRRTYQFDLKSTAHAKGLEDKLVYVARFYYPDDVENLSMMEMKPTEMPVQPPVVATLPVAPMPMSDITNTISAVPVTPVSDATPMEIAGSNYHYTYSGDESIAPVKIYDDGRVTYFQFRAGQSPKIMMVGADGHEIAVPAHKEGDYQVVSAIASKFSVRENNLVVCVFNEQLQAK